MIVNVKVALHHDLVALCVLGDGGGVGVVNIFTCSTTPTESKVHCWEGLALFTYSASPAWLGKFSAALAMDVSLHLPAPCQLGFPLLPYMRDSYKGFLNQLEVRTPSSNSPKGFSPVNPGSL